MPRRKMTAIWRLRLGTWLGASPTTHTKTPEVMASYRILVPINVGYNAEIIAHYDGLCGLDC